MQLTLSLQRQVPLPRQGPVWGAVPPPQAARRGQPGPLGFGLRGLSFQQLPSLLHMGIGLRFLVPLSWRPSLSGCHSVHYGDTLH